MFRRMGGLQMTALGWRVEIKFTGAEAIKRTAHPGVWEHYHTTHDELLAIEMGGRSGPGREQRVIPLYAKDDE